MSQEKYTPTQEEIEKAESMMTPEQTDASWVREELRGRAWFFMPYGSRGAYMFRPGKEFIGNQPGLERIMAILREPEEANPENESVLDRLQMNGDTPVLYIDTSVKKTKQGVAPFKLREIPLTLDEAAIILEVAKSGMSHFGQYGTRELRGSDVFREQNLANIEEYAKKVEEMKKQGKQE